MPALTARPAISRQTLGMMSVAAGVSVFTIQDVIVKTLSSVYPVHQIVVLRSLVAFPILLWVTYAEQRGHIKMHRGLLHAARGFILYISYTCYYLGLARLPMADVIALTFTVPLFVTALGVIVLGEHVRPRRWVALGAGFIGVLVILRPGLGFFDAAALLPIGSALAYATSAVMARRLGSTESGGAMALTATGAYIAGGALTAAVLAGFEPPPGAQESIRFLLNPWIWPSALDLALMALCGCIAAFGFFCLSQGYRLSEAYRAAPCEYAALPWGVLWGYLFFGNTPDTVMILGALIIMGAGLYTLQPDGPARAPS
ncbi:MAG TPA: DMT family transporter [Stellaceae bacterium]|nr:DMT family transporter [Stellaceae bacterium]